MESLFETKEQYLKMRADFRSWYNTEDNRKRLGAEDFALYALLRGKDWRKCFADTTSDSTVEKLHYYLIKMKPQYMFLEPFGDTITEELINSLREREFQRWGE